MRDSPTRLPDRVNKLPKWARDYIHHVNTFVGAEEVQELIFLRSQHRQLVKLVTELKAENQRLKRKLVPCEKNKTSKS